MRRRSNLATEVARGLEARVRRLELAMAALRLAQTEKEELEVFCRHAVQIAREEMAE